MNAGNAEGRLGHRRQCRRVGGRGTAGSGEEVATRGTREWRARERAGGQGGKGVGKFTLYAEGRSGMAAGRTEATWSGRRAAGLVREGRRLTPPGLH